MLRKSLAILFVMVCGALVGAALIYGTVKVTPREPLVSGHPLSYWSICLESDKPEVVQAAQVNLPQFGASAAGPIIERLESPQPATAKAALWALTTLGPAAIPAMTDALGNSGASATKRIILIKRLQVLGAAASAPAEPQIAACLEDSDCSTAAARYFISLGPTPTAVSVSLRVLQGADHTCRLNAIKVLTFAPPEDRIPRALLEAMKTTDHDVYEAARQSPPLIDYMVDRFAENPDSGEDPGAFLVSVGPAAIAPLGRLAKDPRETVRLRTVELLKKIIMATGGSTKPLEIFARDPSGDVCHAALSAIRDVKYRANLAEWNRNPPPLPHSSRWTAARTFTATTRKSFNR